MFRSKTAQRKLKTGIVADDARRKREEAQVELRKSRREENIIKRRTVFGAPSSGAGGAGSMGVPREALSMLGNFSNTSPAAAGLMSVGGVMTHEREQLTNAEQRALAARAAMAEQLPQLVAEVNSELPELQLKGTTQFRKLLSIERNPPIAEVIATGVVPRLIQFLTFDRTPALQFEAAWALTNIASGTTKHTEVVIQNGAIPIFVLLLRSPNAEVQEQAVWALGNIAGDSAVCRDEVLRHNALPPLLELCKPDTKLTMLKNATWTLSNFCRGKPQPNFDTVRPALPVLADLINNVNDVEVLTDACWALSYLSDDLGPANTKIEAVLRSSAAQKLVKLLMHPSPNVKTPALRTIGNIVTGDDIQTQAIISLGALEPLRYLLDRGQKKSIKKEACWTISNITAGNQAQIQAVIEAGIIPLLVSILEQEEFDIQKEAAWAISNATSGGTVQQIRDLYTMRVIKPLCDLFEANDPKIVMVALEGIENMLKSGKELQMSYASEDSSQNEYAREVEECGGLLKLEQLQKHKNQEIYEKTLSIMRNYFEVVEEVQGEGYVDQQPYLSQDGQQYSFGGQSQGGGGYLFPGSPLFVQPQHQQFQQQQQQQQPSLLTQDQYQQYLQYQAFQQQQQQQLQQQGQQQSQQFQFD